MLLQRETTINTHNYLSLEVSFYDPATEEILWLRVSQHANSLLVGTAVTADNRLPRYRHMSIPLDFDALSVFVVLRDDVSRTGKLPDVDRVFHALVKYQELTQRNDNAN